MKGWDLRTARGLMNASYSNQQLALLAQYKPKTEDIVNAYMQEIEDRGKYYADLQASEERRKKEWVNREVAMQAARRIETIEELVNGLEVGIKDSYLRGAYYCRMVELQPMLSPVGRLIAERYIDKYKEIV